MQQVITATQAKKITHGLTPMVPVEYETAVQALTACIELDDAKRWDHQADALAAWAKIYRNDEVGRKAKMLKLHAYRRMGQLAAELRPQKYSDNGATKGAHSLLMESGMTRNAANAATSLGRMTERKFSSVLKAPAAPTTVVKLMNQASPEYGRFSHTAQNLRCFCRSTTPAQMAAIIKTLTGGEAATARALCTEIGDWLDDLEQRLPK